MKLLFSIILLPFTIAKWIVGLVLGSIIRLIVLVLFVFTVGYAGLGWFGWVDAPYLDPIRAGFNTGERLQPTAGGTGI